MGRSVYDANGKVKWVEYPTLTRRLQIYREGLELIIVFRDYDDLFALAVYPPLCNPAVRNQNGRDILHARLEAGLTPERWEISQDACLTVRLSEVSAFFRPDLTFFRKEAAE